MLAANTAIEAAVDADEASSTHGKAVDMDAADGEAPTRSNDLSESCKYPIVQAVNFVNFGKKTCSMFLALTSTYLGPCSDVFLVPRPFLVFNDSLFLPMPLANHNHLCPWSLFLCILSICLWSLTHSITLYPLFVILPSGRCVVSPFQPLAHHFSYHFCPPLHRDLALTLVFDLSVYLHCQDTISN